MSLAIPDDLQPLLHGHSATYSVDQRDSNKFPGETITRVTIHVRTDQFLPWWTRENNGRRGDVNIQHELLQQALTDFEQHLWLNHEEPVARQRVKECPPSSLRETIHAIEAEWHPSNADWFEFVNREINLALLQANR